MTSSSSSSNMLQHEFWLPGHPVQRFFFSNVIFKGEEPQINITQMKFNFIFSHFQPLSKLVDLYPIGPENSTMRLSFQETVGI